METTKKLGRAKNICTAYTNCPNKNNIYQYVNNCSEEEGEMLIFYGPCVKCVTEMMEKQLQIKPKTKFTFKPWEFIKC